MRRREFVTLLGSTTMWPLAARAEPASMPVIGFLSSTSPQAFAVRLPAFARRLKEEGYFEGKNVALEYRWAANHEEQLPMLAAELVHRQVTVIAAGGSSASKAAKAATAFAGPTGDQDTADNQPQDGQGAWHRHSARVKRSSR